MALKNANTAFNILQKSLLHPTPNQDATSIANMIAIVSYNIASENEHLGKLSNAAKALRAGMSLVKNQNAESSLLSKIVHYQKQIIEKLCSTSNTKLILRNAHRAYKSTEKAPSLPSQRCAQNLRNQYISIPKISRNAYFNKPKKHSFSIMTNVSVINREKSMSIIKHKHALPQRKREAFHSIESDNTNGDNCIPCVPSIQAVKNTLHTISNNVSHFNQKLVSFNKL